MPDVEAHITGTVWKIEVEVGDTVEEGDPVVILESMKMEMPVEAEDSGVVKEIRCKEGQAVSEGRRAGRARVAAGQRGCVACGAASYSSQGVKSVLRAPQTGQNQVSGMSSKAVPRGCRRRGRPRRDRRYTRMIRRCTSRAQVSSRCRARVMSAQGLGASDSRTSGRARVAP